MELYNETVWIIMSKDRKVVAKGTPKNRKLVEVGKKDRSRFLTYTSKGIAESGFKNNWFYLSGLSKEYKPEDMEAVECKLTLTI